jgi:DNA ligase (NAD+)
VEKLKDLPRMAEKSADNLVAAIEKSRANPLRRLLFGLGIRFVGEKAARLLAEYFGNLENLSQADTEELTGIEEIGPKIAEAVVSYFQTAETWPVLEKLKKAGVNFSEPDVKSNNAENQFLEGKTFVFSGALSSYSRESAAALVESRGGKVSSSVSKNTDYLVVGEDPGSKLTKAGSLGVEVVSEEQFKRMLGID